MKNEYDVLETKVFETALHLLECAAEDLQKGWVDLADSQAEAAWLKACMWYSQLFALWDATDVESPPHELFLRASLLVDFCQDCRTVAQAVDAGCLEVDNGA